MADEVAFRAACLERFGDIGPRLVFADWLEERGSCAEAAALRRGFLRFFDLDEAYDKRNPDPTKDYGIHGVTMRVAVAGVHGAVSFTLYTSRQLPHVQGETVVRLGGLPPAAFKEDLLAWSGPFPVETLEAVCDELVRYEILLDAAFGKTPRGDMFSGRHRPGPNAYLFAPLAAGLDWHALRPNEPKQRAMSECLYLGGRRCYGDGTVLGAERPYRVLLTQGAEALYRFLERMYEEYGWPTKTMT